MSETPHTPRRRRRARTPGGNPAGRLGAYALVLGLALGGGAAVGSAVGPIDVDEPAPHDDHAGTSAGTSAGAASGTGHEVAAAGTEAALPGGLAVSQSGYTFAPEATVVDGTAGAPFRFRVTGPDGHPVHDYEVAHERELHLIVVGRDLTTYAHLHPTRDGDGTWTTELPALAPGAYRAFADFAVAGGPELTLGVDVTVPGSARPAPLPEAAPTAEVDGYEVSLAGTPTAGAESELELTVERGGEPVTDLEPYLGAAGHLVAIRSGDLAYLHVHPLDEADDRNGPTVRFAVEFPSPGDYRLFLDFAHGGEVRTAAFTVHVPAAGGTPTTTAADAGPTTAPTPAADAGHAGH
jgi:hypothetical protein